MRNKFIAFLTFLSVLFSISAPVNAAEKVSGFNSKQAQEILAALDILNWTPVSKVTKNAFVYSMAGFLYEDAENAGTAEDIAKSIGLIDKNEKFLGSDRISVAEALKYAVITLGYGERTESMGGSDDAYINAASQIGITNGVNLGEEYLQNEDGIKLLWNMLDTEPMVSFYKSADEIGYRIEKNETLLSLNRDIYEIEGLAEANRRTSVYDEKGTGAGTVRIGDVEYSADKAADDLLGRYVSAYVREEKNNDPEIIYIYAPESNNSILTLDGEDIYDIADDFSRIEYEEESGRIKKAKLSGAPKIIYNGVFYGQYTKEDLMPAQGTLELIDNNSDGYYDVVFVTAYQTVVVDGLDDDNKLIKNKFEFEGCMDSVELEPNAGDVEYEIYKNDIEADFSAIKIGDVLSVAASRNMSDRYVRVYVSSAQIQGTVDGKDNEENELSVNGDAKKMSDDFLKYAAHKNKLLNVGTEYIFYLDIFGNIAYLKSVESSDYKMVLKSYEEDENYYIVYMDLDEEWHTSKLAKNVECNEGKFKAAKVNELLGDFKPQIMIIKENAKGEVKLIQKAEQTELYKENVFTKTPETKYVYRTSIMSFANKLYLDDNCKVMVFPAETSYNKEDYYVKEASGYFAGDTSYTVSAYDIDEYGFSGLYSINVSEDLNETNLNKSLFIVTGVFEECDDNGIIYPVIEGNVGSYRNFTLTGNEENIFDDVKPGDILNVSVNQKGYVNYAKKIFSAGDEFKPVGNSDVYKNNTFFAGVIENIDIEALRMKIKCDNSVSLRLDSNIPVQVYNKTRKTCELKTISELKKGDEIYGRITWGKISEIVMVD